MGEFVLIETRARGARWCVVRSRSKNLLTIVAERRRQNFPKTEQEVMTREAWEAELAAKKQLAEFKRIEAEARSEEWNRQFYNANRAPEAA